MLYARKRMRLFLKLTSFIVVGLCSLSLYAKNVAVSLDHTSISKISCVNNDCFFPGQFLSGEDIHVTGQVKWSRSENLVLRTKGSIVFKKDAKILGEGRGSVILKSGMEPGRQEKYSSTVVFEGDSTQIEMLGDGKIKIYYNPSIGEEEHKYHNPDHDFYEQHIRANDLTTYMLVNNVLDLQDITLFLSGDYALSQNIDATETRNWNDGKGFEPLKDDGKKMPFSGDFDGNNYSIRRLFIKRSQEESVGMFGECGKTDISHNVIENVILEDFNITGARFVGSLAGFDANSDLFNIKVN